MQYPATYLKIQQQIIDTRTDKHVVIFIYD